MQMPTSVLIAGCGKLGSPLALTLAHQGYEVHALCRSPRELPGVTLHYHDLSQPLTATLPATDFVFFMLAPTERTEAGYRTVYVQALQHLLTALPRPPQRLFFISSTSVYGQDQGEWVDENSPTHPGSFSGRILLEAEAITRQSTFPATILRLSGIYGAGRNHLLDQLRQGICHPAEPSYYSNRIHQDDAVAAMVHMLQVCKQGKALADCYLLTDSTPAPLHEVCQWLATQLQVCVMETAALRSRGGSKRCCNTRLIETGYAFHYPDYREGYLSLL